MKVPSPTSNSIITLARFATTEKLKKHSIRSASLACAPPRTSRLKPCPLFVLVIEPEELVPMVSAKQPAVIRFPGAIEGLPNSVVDSKKMCLLFLKQRQNHPPSNHRQNHANHNIGHRYRSDRKQRTILRDRTYRCIHPREHLPSAYCSTRRRKMRSIVCSNDRKRTGTVNLTNLESSIKSGVGSSYDLPTS